MKIKNRNRFDIELAKLNKSVIKMGNLIEISFNETIKLLETKDLKLANNIIERDDEIDQMEVEIEADCIKLIYSQQPVASDLRFVTSILKLITDLERIGDNCSDIAEYVIRIENNQSPPIIVENLIDMAHKTEEMFKGTIDSYINLNSEKALKIAADDDIVDEYFEKILVKIQKDMEITPDLIENYTCYIFIIKYLERMADHCCNVCEWIAYRVTGKHDPHIY